MLKASIKKKRKKKNEMETILQNFLLALDSAISCVFIQQKEDTYNHYLINDILVTQYLTLCRLLQECSSAPSCFRGPALGSNYILQRAQLCNLVLYSI